ncbi:MAG: DUF1780 domain-containing protein [Polaromonas sp.]
MNEREFLRRLTDEADDTDRLLSNARKSERERRVCAAFLRCAGVLFDPAELKNPQQEPPDVCFREAAFEVKMLLGGRKIHGEWKAIAQRRRSAQSIDEVLEPAVHPQPISFADVLLMVEDELDKQTYDQQTCAALDVLLYVNIKGRFLNVQCPLPQTFAIGQKGFRSVCILFPPYAWVVTATASSPPFLRERIGKVQHCCMDPDAYFAL